MNKKHLDCVPFSPSTSSVFSDKAMDGDHFPFSDLQEVENRLLKFKQMDLFQIYVSACRGIQTKSQNGGNSF